jgi:PIN domain nuclease of toxin-antitoxin system
MLLLDTHAWFWWVQDPIQIPPKTRRRLEEEEVGGSLLVSAVSVWEIALKTSIGKLELPMDVRSWVAAAKAYPAIHVLPLSDEVALESTLLPGAFPNDPADRFLVALARMKRVPLVTADRKIRDYPYVDTIWD